MEWLAIGGLFVWVVVLANRVERLKHTLSQLQARPEPQRAPAAPPLTSLSGTPATAPIRAPEARRPEPVPRRTAAEERPEIAPPAPILPPQTPPRRPAFAADRWLAENGLAWLGGGALALGAAFLVGFAVREGVFTPERRVWAGVVLGVALLGASEALRRLRPGHRWSHPLAAAVAAGAGAAALYAAVWAAHALYGMVGAPAAAALLAGVSALLMALSFRHGEPLAVLALAGALIAPLATGADSWRFEALAFYLVATLVTGAAVARWRLWAGVAVVALAGGIAWAALAVLDESAWRAVGLLTLGVGGALATVVGREGETSAWRLLRERLAGAALVGGSLIALGVWLGPGFPEAGGVAIQVMIALAALAVGTRVAPPVALAAPAILCVAAGFLRFGSDEGGAFEAGGWMILWAGALIAGAALAARRSGGTDADAAGALGGFGLAAALIWSLSRYAPADTATAQAAAAAGVALALLAAGLTRGGGVAGERRPSDFWGGGAAGALLIALLAGLAPTGEGVGCAGLAVLFAALGRWTRWRVWPGAGLIAAGLSLAALFQPAVFAPALDGRADWTAAVLPPGGAAVLLTLAALAFRRWGAREDAWQGLLTAAVIAALTGAFLILRRLAGDGAGLDALMEAGLRTVLLLAAGLLSARFALGVDVIARLRTHALLLGGAAYGFIEAAVLLNPWWGWITPEVRGPPLVDAVTLAILAPAVLLALASRLFYPRERRWGRVYAAGGAAMLALFAVTETRRLFHAPALDLGPVLTMEGLVYGVLALSLAWLAREAVRRGGGGEAADDVAGAARRLLWLGLAMSLVSSWVLWNPWWGAAAQPLPNSLHAAGAGLALLGTAAICLAIVRRTRVEPLRDTALSTATAQVFLLLTLAIRLRFRGLDLRGALDSGGLETWAYSAAWAVFGLAVLALGARSGDVLLRRLGLVALLAATLKVFLFDMSALEGVLRAASFLGLGAVLLAGAVAARRLGVVPTSASGDAEPR